MEALILCLSKAGKPLDKYKSTSIPLGPQPPSCLKPTSLAPFNNFGAHFSDAEARLSPIVALSGYFRARGCRATRELVPTPLLPRFAQCNAELITSRNIRYIRIGDGYHRGHQLNFTEISLQRSDRQLKHLPHICLHLTNELSLCNNSGVEIIYGKSRIAREKPSCFRTRASLSLARQEEAQHHVWHSV
jgi:hypothetical protein